ncbi:curli assembly protein CsgF [Christiangramia sp. OXR-203]|jgi:curli production assembly/transport component CsgF|uniref:curli production assembly/transport component CsgF n=1 Tax=Christiangramia sp. OXR-203 TaxID=3100176 RepID=UPI002AC9281E|nr:curli assembly protein CsgF [Christiangramia sp. OXR-203]WPY97979.1 curli assembly protein CsgF [Christiangramia sp. OXR-203]
MKKLIFFSILISCLGMSAQDLVYTPKNPAFGGDTFNYQWLLSSAQAQNSFTAPRDEREDLSELDQFTESLNRQLLSQVSRNLFFTQFGEGELTEGRYTFGNLAIDIYPSDGGLVIDILDTTTGDQTQITIPNS